MHIYSFNNLKFTLKHLKRPYVFRSYDHTQEAYFVPYWSYSLKHSVICEINIHNYQINITKQIAECFKL